MSKEFSSPPQFGATNIPVATPYLKARQQWDERIGTSVVQAKNWRLAFLLASVTGLLLLVANIVQLSQQKLIPVVIAMDTKTGAPNVLGEVTTIKYEPNELQTKYFLGKFIEKVRGLPLDPVVLRSNWAEAYKFLRRGAANQLNGLMNSDEDAPYKKVGKLTVAVQVVSIVRVGAGRSYQGRWQETIYDQNGRIVDQYLMTGVFTLELETPRTRDVISANPLGLFIKAFQWNKEITGGK